MSFSLRKKERQKKEMETEVKRRKEEWEHEMMMMQVVENIFNQMAVSFNSFAAPMPSTSLIYNHCNFQLREMTQKSTSYNESQKDWQNRKLHESGNYSTNLLTKKQQN